MTTAPTRPSTSRSGDADRADDGYFGPGSVTWRVYADPAHALGGLAGLLLQALNPYMMRVFYNATNSHDDVAGRSARTDRWLQTITFGDRAHADAAAEVVQRMHARAVWTDPATGRELRADDPDWLAWTHNSLVYGMLRACDAFGLPLTRAEQDRFVQEQHQAARLAGIEDLDSLPRTAAELDAYVEEQKHWLALSIEAAEVTRGLRAPKLWGNPVKVFTTVVVQDGVLSILPEWARLLYGVEGRPMHLRGAARTTKQLMGLARRSAKYADVVAASLRQVDEHPYRKVRKAR